MKQKRFLHKNELVHRAQQVSMDFRNLSCARNVGLGTRKHVQISCVQRKAVLGIS